MTVRTEDGSLEGELAILEGERPRLWRREREAAAIVGAFAERVLS